MKSPHLVDLSRDLVAFQSNLGRILAESLADFSRDFSRDFASKTREFFNKIKVAERTRNKFHQIFGDRDREGQISEN